MSIGYIGADPDQLDALGRGLDEGTDRLHSLRNGLGLQLLHGTWVGLDADDARSDWEISHSPALAAAAEALASMGLMLRTHAQAQRLASGLDMMQTGGGEGGWPPPDYPGDGDPEALRQYWLNIAAANAGIDMSLWDASLGAANQAPIIEAVYTYYANLYLENPHFYWAGMANMVGPSFAAGFYDIELFGQVAGALEFIGPLLPLPPGTPISLIAGISESDLAYYEQTFLQMQQDIFVDQAVMHEAYLAGGLPAVQDLYDAGIIDQATFTAWEQIDEGYRTGNTDLLEQGNGGLLLREQRDIIDGYYQDMYNHLPTGPAFTYLLGVIGDPAIPGAATFAEWDPLVVSYDSLSLLPGGSIIAPFVPSPNLDVTTPLPDGNLALFNDRWEYMSGDTLPVYLDYIQNHPDEAAAIIGTPVDQRIEEYRLTNRVDDIVNSFTNWGAGVSVR